MDKIKALKYLGPDGNERTIEYTEFPAKDIPGNVVISLGRERPEIYDRVRENANFYFATTVETGYWGDMYNQLSFTPEEAVFSAVPWHAFRYWGEETIVEVFNESLWNRVLYLRKQDEAHTARLKLELKRSEQERKEAAARKRKDFYTWLEAGATLTKRKTGTFQRHFEKEGWIDTNGYLVVNRETEEPLPFGVEGGGGYWNVHHLPSGALISNACSPTLKEACAVAGAIYLMVEEDWYTDNPLGEMPEDLYKEIYNFLLDYRDETWR